uniref:DNA polymerase delta catalytic subunit-like n=1 Tax=Lonchura striata TaxID=40157 RepID=UPI001293E4CE|nr:DNA polymerase delta catalytic subunit-like [Lonchura striata domestica]
MEAAGGAGPGGPGRFRGVPRGPSRFEEELAQLHDEEEEEEEEEEGLAPDPRCQPRGSLFVGEVPPKWRRPAPPPQPPESLTFLQLDIDHYVGVPPRGFPGWPHPSPILRMFGVTGEGLSVCLHLHGFSPYFYVLAPPGASEAHLEPLERELEAALRREQRGGTPKSAPPKNVLGLQLVRKQSEESPGTRN